MIHPDDLKSALAEHFGQEITPSVAAAIFVAALKGSDRSIPPKRFAPRDLRDGYVAAVESFREILPELHPLHALQFSETERYREHIGLRPDYQALERDERDGKLVQFTLRREGVLVGNIRVYLGTSRHTSTTFAKEDTFFVVPAHRKGLLAMRFWRYAEDCLRDLGVVEVRTDAKLANRADKLNKFMGYEPVSTGFVKILRGSSHVQ